LFEDTITHESSSIKHSKTGLTGVSSHGNTSTSNDNGNGTKRQRNLQSDYFVFDTPTISGISNMNNMSFSQPFQGQYVQSPPGQFQFPQQNQPPQWALDIISDIQVIKQKVEKIDNTVNIINMKFADLEVKVNEIDNRVNEVESTVSFLSNEYDMQAKDIKCSQDKINNLDQARKSLDKTVNMIQEQQAEIRAKTLDNEFRSMRENLIFYGIPETPETTQPKQPTSTSGLSQDEPSIQTKSSENQTCEELVKGFITTKLDIDSEHMLFDRAHRLGNPKTAKLPRPIIVKFHYFKEREIVREASFQKKEKLKEIKCGVSAQIPKEWREARQKLSTVYQAEKSKGNKVKFVGENLYVNGVIYKSSHISA
jgi:hypothetical protein